MAWEPRGTHTYYYRSVRRNGRVTKEYLGTGPLAALSVAAEAQRRAHSVKKRLRPGARHKRRWRRSIGSLTPGGTWGLWS
jgi:hypothetical protein